MSADEFLMSAEKRSHWLSALDREGFGNSTMDRECEAVCPKSISVNFIARMNREYLSSILK